MKKLLFAAVMLTAITFTGCKSGDSGDPKVVLSEFFDALGKGNMEKAKELATPESSSMLGLMEMGMKSDKGEMSKYDSKKITYGTPVIEGDKATVPATVSGETMNYTLKKMDGKWKVAFDKTSMMTMGMDKMKEKGMNPADSLNKAMDELKNMDMDSITNEMNKMTDTARMQ